MKPNPVVLHWALTLSGLEPAQAKVRPEWLRGEETMTYPQLAEVARRLDVPLATFFLDAPPPLDPIEVDFRQRLQQGDRRLHPKVTQEVRRLVELQKGLSELNFLPAAEGLSELRSRAGQCSPTLLAQQARSYLQIDFSQQLACDSAYEALNFWRSKIESLGLYVLQITVEESDLEGLSIATRAPAVIGLSAKFPPTARQFTLAHELYHVLTGASSILFAEEHTLKGALNEDAANEFAAELLLPTSHPVVRELLQQADTPATMKTVARKLRLSYAFVLRQTAKVLAFTSEQMAALWKAAPAESKQSTGGDFYRNQASRFGATLLNQVFSAYDRGVVSPAEVSHLLRIKVEQFDGVRAQIG